MHTGVFVWNVSGPTAVLNFSTVLPTVNGTSGPLLFVLDAGVRLRIEFLSGLQAERPQAAVKNAAAVYADLPDRKSVV